MSALYTPNSMFFLRCSAVSRQPQESASYKSQCQYPQEFHRPASNMSLQGLVSNKVNYWSTSALKVGISAREVSVA